MTFSTRIRWKRSMKTELFENALQSGTFWKRCFRTYVWRDENGTFGKRWGHTITSNPLRAILETYSEDGGRALPFLAFILGLISNRNRLFSSKFGSVNSSSWLFQEAAEHYQVTFATGVKRRKVGSPFSFLPCFWHFKLFLRHWRTSQHYKPTLKKFENGANQEPMGFCPSLLFRGLIIANTHASSMSSRVSYRFLKSIHRRTCEREFFWKGRKKVAFSNEYGYVYTRPERLFRETEELKKLFYCNI